MSRRGFSLIELVVVLVILGIAAAAVVPAVASVREDPVARAADETARLLRTARRAAVERAGPVRVTLDSRTGGYEVRMATVAGRDSVTAGTLPLAPGVRITAREAHAVFVFDPLGGASGPVLAIRGGDGAATVEVDRWTGEVRAAR